MLATHPITVTQVWNEILAPKFIRHRRVLSDGAEPHGRRALALHAPELGASAVDVGCGFGEATAELAELVGPTGLATGLDLVPAFLALAREETRDQSLPQLRFVAADAATFSADEPIDYLFSRFGTMFFERPVAAFGNLRRMLRPGGQLVMTTWRRLEENPWLGIAKRAALSVLPAPGTDAVSCGPGPFSLARMDVMRIVLQQAGFREVSFTRSDGVTLLGRTMKSAVDFQMALGPAGEIVREAGAAGELRLPDVRGAIAHALSPYLCEDGVLVPSAAWIVRAVSPH